MARDDHPEGFIYAPKVSLTEDPCQDLPTHSGISKGHFEGPGVRLYVFHAP